MAITNPFYQSPHSFAPSSAALKLWLKTRKTNREFHPGAFDTIGFSTDLTWALVAIFIEVIAAATTLHAGWTTNTKNAVASVIVVVLFVGLDIIGVMLHKSPQGDKCYHRNAAFVSKNPVLVNYHLKQASQLTSSELFGLLLIVLSAGLKILGLLVFIGRSKMFGVAVIGLGSLFYAVVVYIHTNHTGYWLAALNANQAIKQEFNKWSNTLSKGGAVPSVQVTQTFNSSSNTHLVTPLNSGRQSLSSKSNGDGTFQFTLISNGLVWDQDLINLSALIADPQLVMDLKHEVTKMQFSAAGIVLTPVGPNNPGQAGPQVPQSN